MLGTTVQWHKVTRLLISSKSAVKTSDTTCSQTSHCKFVPPTASVKILQHNNKPVASSFVVTSKFSLWPFVIHKLVPWFLFIMSSFIQADISEEYNDRWTMNRKIFRRNRLWPNLKYSLTIFHTISLTRARPLSQDDLPDTKPNLQPSNHDVQLLYLIHFLTLPV
jgi:hypothetical protein